MRKNRRRKKKKRRKVRRKRKRKGKKGETNINWIIIINRLPFKFIWIIAHTYGA